MRRGPCHLGCTLGVLPGNSPSNLRVFPGWLGLAGLGRSAQAETPALGGGVRAGLACLPWTPCTVSPDMVPSLSLWSPQLLALQGSQCAGLWSQRQPLYLGWGAIGASIAHLGQGAGLHRGSHLGQAHRVSGTGVVGALWRGSSLRVCRSPLSWLWQGQSLDEGQGGLSGRAGQSWGWVHPAMGEGPVPWMACKAHFLGLCLVPPCAGLPSLDSPQGSTLGAWSLGLPQHRPGHPGARVVGGRSEPPQPAAGWAPASPPPMQMPEVSGGLLWSWGEWGFPPQPSPALWFPSSMLLEIFASVFVPVCWVGVGATACAHGSCFSDWARGRRAAHLAAPVGAVRVLAGPQRLQPCLAACGMLAWVMPFVGRLWAAEVPSLSGA